jgi:hypothetical protein
VLTWLARPVLPGLRMLTVEMYAFVGKFLQRYFIAGLTAGLTGSVKS